MKLMLIFNGLSAVFALTSAVVLYATYLGTAEAKWSIYLAGCFCSIIAVHQTVSFFFALGLRQKFKRGRTGTERSIQRKPEDMPLLETAETGPIIAAPSVTENTTELLESSHPHERPRGLREG